VVRVVVSSAFACIVILVRIDIVSIVIRNMTLLVVVIVSIIGPITLQKRILHHLLHFGILVFPLGFDERIQFGGCEDKVPSGGQVDTVAVAVAVAVVDAEVLDEIVGIVGIASRVAVVTVVVVFAEGFFDSAEVINVVIVATKGLGMMELHHFLKVVTDTLVDLVGVVNFRIGIGVVAQTVGVQGGKMAMEGVLVVEALGEGASRAGRVACCCAASHSHSGSWREGILEVCQSGGKGFVNLIIVLIAIVIAVDVVLLRTPLATAVAAIPLNGDEVSELVLFVERRLEVPIVSVGSGSSSGSSRGVIARARAALVAALGIVLVIAALGDLAVQTKSLRHLDDAVGQLDPPPPPDSLPPSHSKQRLLSRPLLPRQPLPFPLPLSRRRFLPSKQLPFHRLAVQKLLVDHLIARLGDDAMGGDFFFEGFLEVFVRRDELGSLHLAVRRAAALGAQEGPAGGIPVDIAMVAVAFWRWDGLAVGNGVTIHFLHERVIIGSAWMMPILLLTLTVLLRLKRLFHEVGHIINRAVLSRT